MLLLERRAIPSALLAVRAQQPLELGLLAPAARRPALRGAAGLEVRADGDAVDEREGAEGAREPEDVLRCS